MNSEVMVEKLLQYFSKFRPLTQSEKDAISQDIDIRNFKKRKVLLKEGQVSRDNYFVIEGCVRQYILKDGTERITNFYSAEDWILPAIGQSDQQTSTFYLECVQDSVLVIANENQGSEFMRTNPKFIELSQMILEKEILKQQQHFTEYQNNTPEERYLNLIQKSPHLIQTISQIHLASYIGVKPESLSRIKNRLAKNRTNTNQ